MDIPAERVSYMISSRMFERFVMPDLEACCDHLDHAFYHLDGRGEIPHLDQLLSLQRLRGIQWVPGNSQPSPDRWPELLARIRGGGKLCQVFVTPQEALRIAWEVGAAGFLLVIQADHNDFRDAQSARSFLDALAREDASNQTLSRRRLPEASVAGTIGAARRCRVVRVGMIGCGGMGNYHGPEIARLPNVRIVGTCDLIADKARALADKVGVARWCTDYRELLSDADAVWVCTEPFNRVEIVTAAAAAGKHIFTEKPICNTAKGADEMIAATKKAGVVYMLGYCLRFWQPYRVLHDTFGRGELGDLVSCWMRRFMSWDPSGLWYAWQDKSGGAMLDFGSHDVDWLRWVGGDVKTVFGRTARVRDTLHADEHGAAILVFEKGGFATVEDSWCSHLNDSSIGIIGTKGSMIVGPDGKVRKKIGYAGVEETVDVEAAMAIDPSGNVGRKDAAGAITRTTTANESIQQHFFRCIEERVEPLTPGTEGRKTFATVAALWESSRRGEAVVVSSVMSG